MRALSRRRDASGILSISAAAWLAGPAAKLDAACVAALPTMRWQVR